MQKKSKRGKDLTFDVLSPPLLPSHRADGESGDLRKQKKQLVLLRDSDLDLHKID